MIEHVKQAIETDGGTIEGIKGSHSHILLEATWVQRHRLQRTLFVEPDGLDENELGDVKNDFNISLQDFLGRARDTVLPGLSGIRVRADKQQA
jgi:hypothetical protein